MLFKMIFCGFAGTVFERALEQKYLVEVNNRDDITALMTVGLVSLFLL